MHSSLQSAVFILIVFATSCTEQEVVERPCGEHGWSIEGTDECFCNPFSYYEGPFCQTETREKFIGRWKGYNYQCAWGDSLPNGFIVEIVKADQISEVKIISPAIFPQDTLAVGVDPLGFLRHHQYQLVGNQIYWTFDMDLFHHPDTDELSVHIGRNPDLDEFTENCNYMLRRE